MGGKIDKKKKPSSADTTQAHVCTEKLLHSKLEHEAVGHWIPQLINFDPVGSWCAVLSLGAFKLQSLNCFSPVELNPLCPWGVVLVCSPSHSAVLALSPEALSRLSK